jgi:hypothetical protein
VNSGLILTFIGYAAVLALLVYLYVSLLAQARWLGASNIANTVILLALALSASAPYFAVWQGASPAVCAVLVAGPVVVLLAIGLRRTVQHTGGLRPEAELFYAFKRINRIGLGGKTGDRKGPRDNEMVLAELAGLERLRKPNTTRVIDALERINHDWVYSSEPLTPGVIDDWNLELGNAAQELWGPGWQGRPW